MRLAYDNIQATGLFSEPCREWRKKPTADKTYLALGVHFSASDKDRRQNETTSGTAGYSANAVRELVREEFSTMLTDQNSPATDQPMTHGDFEAMLAAAGTPSGETDEQPDQANAVTRADLDALLQKFMDSQNSGRGRHRDRNRDRNRNRDPSPASQGTDDDGKPITYCWSHGVTHNLKHHSGSCRRKKEGHKDAATLSNRMGGSNEICKPARSYWNNRDRNH